MTLSTTHNKVRYTCDGNTDTFPYTFRVLDSADLYVVYTSLAGADTQWTENTEYTVTNIGEEEGGNVVVDELYVPSSGTHLTIYREVPYTQESDYVENDPFHADTLETDLDRIVMIIQQLAEALSRALYLSITDGSNPTMEIPGLADRADSYLGFDSDGDLTVYTGQPTQLIEPGTDNNIVVYDGDSTRYLKSSGVDIDDIYNKSEVDALIPTDFYTTSEVDALIATVSGADVSSVTINNSLDDLTGQGEVLDGAVAGENLAFGNFVYCKSDSTYWKASKTHTSYMPVIGMVLETITTGNSGRILLSGVARNDSWNWSTGSIIYCDTGGAGSHTPPSTTGHQLQVLGVAVSAKKIRFNPDFTLVEVE